MRTVWEATGPGILATLALARISHQGQRKRGSAVRSDANVEKSTYLVEMQ